MRGAWVQRLLDDYYDRVLQANADAGIQCRRGCSACCSQMVFGVAPIELELLGRLLRREGRSERMIGALRERVRHFDRVRMHTDRRPGETAEEHAERIAIRFHREDLPCTLLASDGSCSIHALRPYACRRFFSLSDPSLCRGEGVQHRDYRGFMFEPLADFDAMLAGSSEQIPFDPGTDELDRGLLRWLENRDPRII
jgi:Fe-S-cluster containining protein